MRVTTSQPHAAAVFSRKSSTTLWPPPEAVASTIAFLPKKAGRIRLYMKYSTKFFISPATLNVCTGDARIKPWLFSIFSTIGPIVSKSGQVSSPTLIHHKTVTPVFVKICIRTRSVGLISSCLRSTAQFDTCCSPRFVESR